MSIRAVIGDKIAHGQLEQLIPILPSDPVVRTMLITREIKALLQGPWDDVSAERRAWRLRADLEAFVKGDVVSIGWDPRDKDNSAYMARLEPVEDGMWDMRSRDPSPALRVVGSFALPDTFVCLDWSTREFLGARDSREWQDLIVNSKTEWRNLFHPYLPHQGKTANDYVTSDTILV